MSCDMKTSRGINTDALTSIKWNCVNLNHLNTLPLELLQHVANHLEVRSYHRLRCCSRRLANLSETPSLLFGAYQESTNELGDILVKAPRIQISMDCVSNECIMYLTSLCLYCISRACTGVPSSYCSQRCQNIPEYKTEGFLCNHGF